VSKRKDAKAHVQQLRIDVRESAADLRTHRDADLQSLAHLQTCMSRPRPPSHEDAPTQYHTAGGSGAAVMQSLGKHAAETLNAAYLHGSSKGVRSTCWMGAAAI
jgi:hypothetical protein